MKLAGYVNTDQDEDYPFMHPDGRRFFFSSRGHNSMGGYDVFRCTHDPGLDVFGPPENMDFAVNTPDDDILYLVDGEGTQACFASARDSRQDMIHVYRVSTTQVPVTITVLKGTFSSAFDPSDREAHIVVEDGVTREEVAELHTDIDGNYLVALPRTGRFRFLVKAGPSGKTHAGMVDVPRSADPRAYRQELQLVQKDGREQLVIRNYFDEPLNDDILALAMDEIRRRAKLEVNTTPEERTEPEATASVSDVMSEAGFTGDKTIADAVRMAGEQAATSDREAFDLAEPPQRIEVYDNSHIMGTNAVGVMIVAGPEGFEKGQYRKFNIKSENLTPGDDYAMMREVLTRRFTRLLKENAEGDNPGRDGGERDAAWPDLLLIDGGKGQLGAVVGVMEELGISDVCVVGVAKGPERDAGREHFFMPGRESFRLEPRDPVLYYLQRLRDEAHRFAIGTHRARRKTAMAKNPLDEISGIGPTRKRALLMHFGSAKAVSRAGLADLEATPGISRQMARLVYDHFHEGGNA